MSTRQNTNYSSEKIFYDLRSEFEPKEKIASAGKAVSGNLSRWW